ncbi:MAG: hypothetical protein WKG32_10145 [Gemmatimonadaceae bacterium]
MDNIYVIMLLRLLHIVLGVFWVGASVLLAAFLLPTVRALGPVGGQVMDQLARVRKLPLYLMAAGIPTVLSGIALYWRDSAGFRGEWMRSGPGTTFGIGALLALVAMVIGMAINSPTAKKAAALGAAMQAAGRPPAPEQLAQIQQLQARLYRATVGAAVLLALATAAMAVARYMPS